MELNELKNIWQKEKKELESRINLDEKRIRELSENKSKGAFNKLLKTAILGRNLALVYMLISIFVASRIFYDFQNSIPVILGGIAMLISFFQHISLEKPNFDRMNTIELQKTICRFRIHTSKYAKYDIAIVSLWLISLLPVYLAYALKINYTFLQLFPFMALIIVLTILFSRPIYNKWNNKLKENEEALNEIIEFENNNVC